MYKLDPHILNPTKDFDFVLNGVDIIDMTSFIDLIPSKEILVSTELISLSLCEYPYDSMYDNPAAVPIITYLLNWLKEKNFSSSVNLEEVQFRENIKTSPNIFSDNHSNDFKKVYTSNLLDVKAESKEYFVTSSTLTTEDFKNKLNVEVFSDYKLISSLSLLYDMNINDHLDSIKLIFEANPKHKYYHGNEATILPADLESRCQSILENSLIDNDNPKTRYGYDNVTKTFVKFMRHGNYTFHAYPVTINERDIPSSHIRKQLRHLYSTK